MSSFSRYRPLGAMLAACLALILVAVGTTAAPTAAPRRRDPSAAVNVTEILLAIAASKPPSSPRTARQRAVELSYELNQNNFDNMAARANRDFGTGSLSFTFAASDGSCGTAEFRRVAANDEAAVYRFDDARWQMIVFKGSEDSEDWADNILGIFRADCNLEGPCGGVHSGWLDELKERSAMHVNMFMDFRTLITGFSLGGAIATLDGYVHARWGVPEVRIVTFGAPQVGDDDWVAAFGRAGVASYNRYVNVQGGRADPVTNMPGTFVGYRHVGTYREVEQGASHDMTAYERGVAGRDPNCRWGGSDDDGSSKGSSDAAMYAGGGYRSGCPSGPPSYSREAVDRTPYRTCQAPNNGPSYSGGSGYMCLQDESGRDSWVPVRRTGAGQIGCMSTNSWDCIWVPRACCESLAASGTDRSPFFECGPLHFTIWQTSGYMDPSHWCYRGWQILNPGQQVPYLGC